MKSESRAVTREILKNREKVGWYALGATALLGIILVASEAPEVLKALLFIPAFISALGFLQSWFRFIVPMQHTELYDVVKYENGQKLPVGKQKFQTQARMLLLACAGIALLITASAFSS